MTLTNVFRDLPYHILKDIIWLSWKPQSEFDDVELSDAIKRPVLPTLHTCHSWRLVVLSMLYDYGNIIIRKDATFKYRIYERMRDYITNDMNEQYNVHVQHVDLDFSLRSVIEGRALEAIDLLRCGNFVFPSVSSIKMEISISSMQMPDYAQANAKINAFVQIVQHMFPSFNIINLSFTSLLGDIYPQSKPYLTLLFSGLSKNAYIQSMLITSAGTTAGLETIPSFTGLTKLECSWHEEHEGMVELIYANAPTLQHLQIYFHEFTGIGLLVKNEQTREYLHYPHLSCLSMIGFNFPVEHVVPSTADAIIFPRLQAVGINFEYPFSDNVLLRGNQWRLEELYIVLSMRAITCLGLHDLLCIGKVTPLQEISLAGNDAIAEGTVLDDASRQLFRGALGQVKHLAVQPQPLFNLLMQSIPKDAQYPSITRLNIVCTAVTFSEIVLLLRALPNIRIIKSKMTSLGNDFSALNIKRILAEVRSRFSPLNRSLTSWCIYNANISTVPLISCCILALADQCPNLRGVVFKETAYVSSFGVFQNLQKSKQLAKSGLNLPSLEFKHHSASDKALIKVFRK